MRNTFPSPHPSSLLSYIHIPFSLHNPPHIIPICKGFSTDKKYIIVTKEGPKLLLKTFDNQHMEQKHQEYEILVKMKQNHLPCSKPLQIGTIERYKLGYILLSFIDGKDARSQLPHCKQEEQYFIGVEAGQSLRLIHQHQAPSHIKPWSDRKQSQYKHTIQTYKQCGVTINHDFKIMYFIEEHMHVMQGRPNQCQHNDFHIDNIIVKNKAFAGIIDFHGFNWGDPMHDFHPLGLLSREISIPYCIGQIKGYFHPHEPPPSFWKQYSLYLAMYLFYSVVWITHFKGGESKQMMDRINTVLEDHHYFDKTKPAWYKGDVISHNI
ncbi:aminoglycoside phosphotransferase family protein [Longirhabdus pacifica]|uniref:aminoglycoside phosphotransferase family protein n=1 Tax=Longirhabdus pacifica TaxID=2305227 RepID=UPI0010092046|nr:aminoglycoside phosphotransferase family protein [Longirhabdus pacifica]